MDPLELEERIEALHPASFAWALACCGRNRDEGEEVLQMAYLKVVEGKARFRGESSFKTWLFSVIRRTAMERFRWRHALDRVLAVAARQPAALSGRADDAIVRSETSRRLLESLSQLARRQREVLELVFYHEMTIEEAAQTLGISLGSARVHYERGKKRMLARMKKEELIAFA